MTHMYIQNIWNIYVDHPKTSNRRSYGVEANLENFYLPICNSWRVQ